MAPFIYNFYTVTDKLACSTDIELPVFITSFQICQNSLIPLTFS